MPTENPSPPGEQETCALCGKPAAIVIDNAGWCAECLHAAGSCCGEWTPEPREKVPEETQEKS